MPNRKERRSRDKLRRKGIPEQYDQTHGRARSGLIDEYALQERSRRLQEHGNGPWKPSSNVLDEEHIMQTNKQRVLHENTGFGTARKVLSVIAWLMIILSAIAFFVLMWLPGKSLVLVLAVSIIFTLGVIGLFFINGNAQRNPRLDAHGTAL